ncbi:MAG: MotA/TolQ/ExbB proton channel family protein [Lysobacterales bacterium]
MAWLSDIPNNLAEFIELGGGVLWAIMAVLLLMWTFILERLWYFRVVHPKKVRQVIGAWDARVDTTSWHAKQIRNAMISEVNSDLGRNVLLVKTLIALCPLLGLLGTVTGMLNVFDIMAIAGTGNARAMAAGVSKATVPTMAGMVAALSGVYFGTRFEYWHTTETHKLGDLMQHH